MAEVVLIFVVGIFIALRLFFWLTVFPNSDEAYYWWWGQNWDLSYYDHPPLMAWLLGTVSLIFENSLFGLRLLNLVTNLALFVIYWYLLRYLLGDKANGYFLTLLVIVFCSPLFFVMLSLAWHDHLLIALCLGSSYWLVRFLDDFRWGRGEREWQLYLSILLLALAMITKYNAALMGLGFLVTIGGDRSLRRVISWGRVGGAMLVFGVVFCPVLLWNFYHNFPSFSYYLNRSVTMGNPIQRLLEPLGFLSISLLMFSPCLGWLLWRSWRLLDEKIFIRKTIYLRLAWCCFIVPTVILGLVSLVSTAYYYWNITAYLLVIPLMTIVLNSLAIKRAMMVYGVLFALIFCFNYGVLPISALWGTDGDQDGRMLFGWERVQEQVLQMAGGTMPRVVTTDYRSGAALSFQLNGAQVGVISKRISHFDFVSYADSFSPNLVLWDDWYPIQEWHKNKLKIDYNRQVTVRVDRFGVFIKNYYLAPVIGTKDSGK